MKILFITTGSQATFYAVAPLATAARNAGHQVILAAHEPWIETAEAIGIPTVCYTSDPVRQFMRAGGPGSPMRAPREMGDDDMLGVGRGFAKIASNGLGTLLDLARDWPPDLVIGSSMSFVAGLLAAHLGVPYVRQIEYFAIPMTGIDLGAEAALQPELKRLGLSGLPEPALYVDATPPSLRPSCDPAALPVRWVPSNPQRRLERWMYTRPEGRRRVVITSGFRSLMFRTPGWSMPSLVAQLERAGAEVLIPASPGAAERFGSGLGGARVGWIPVDVVSHTCDLAVHHGGATTATTFAAAGVPQLVIPENPPEMPYNYHRMNIARTLTDFGSGRTLLPQEQAPGQDPGEVIAAACLDILATASYAQRARALAAEIAGLPTPPEVFQKLEALVAP